MNRRRTIVLAATVGLSLTLVQGTGFVLATRSEATSQEQPPAVSPGVLERQAELQVTAQELQQAFDPFEGSRVANEAADGSGYAGVTIAPVEGRLTLYWHGAVAEQAREILSRAVPGVEVEVVSAVHTLHDLQLGALQTFEANESWAILGDVAMITPRSDGSALEVEFVPKTGATVDEVALQLERSSGVATAVQLVSGHPILLDNRPDDISPFDGGAAYYAVSQGTPCSTGFSVESTSTGNDYQLTAYHCFYPSGGTNILSPAGGNVLGTWYPISSRNKPAYDSALVQQTLNQGNVFAGDTYSTSKIGIGNAIYNTVGAYACTMGANSGAHCSLEIYSKNSYVAHGADGSLLQSVVIGGYASGVAVVSGDSGGPVVEAAGLPRDGLGVISFAPWGYATPCSGVTYWSQPDSCHRRAGWIGLKPILQEYENLVLK